MTDRMIQVPESAARIVTEDAFDTRSEGRRKYAPEEVESAVRRIAALLPEPEWEPPHKLVELEMRARGWNIGTVQRADVEHVEKRLKALHAQGVSFLVDGEPT